jgi:hypothetical protein
MANPPNLQFKTTTGVAVSLSRIGALISETEFDRVKPTDRPFLYVPIHELIRR